MSLLAADVDYSRLLGSVEMVVDSENKPPVTEKDKCFFLSSADIFQYHLFQNKLQEYHQNVNQFGSRSGRTYCLT